MPAFFGCSDVDAHVPRARVEESAGVFSTLNANVTMIIYPNMGHLVSDDEIEHAQRVLDEAAEAR
jgi:phospholipase/carboxylesterase